MWFRNLIPYRLREPVAYDPESADSRLATLAFTPCGALEPSRSGFVPPLGPGAPLVHAAAGSLLLCLQEETKLLPVPSPHARGTATSVHHRYRWFHPRTREEQYP